MNVPLCHARLGELPHQARSLVRVTGDDATRFLQGLLTADVGELTPGRASAAALLTVKGKIVSEVWVLARSEDEPWLALPAEIGAEVLAKLDAHIIMDDVELEALPDHDLVLVWREDGGAVEVTGLGPIPADVQVYAAAHPLPGLLLVGPAPSLAALELGPAASAEQFTAARIARGRPAWGFEIAAERFPPEVGFVDAVSYDKGCYLGQEPLSRIHNRGQVNNVMVRVRVEDDDAASLALPSPLREVEGERELGTLTTRGGADGLAIVRRAAAKPGTRLTAPGGTVEVVSGPLGDDPGSKSRQTGTVTLGGKR